MTPFASHGAFPGMRFYVKLLVLVALFAFAQSSLGRRTMADGAFRMRVAWAARFGTDADRSALLDEVGVALAREAGTLKLYEAGMRYRELLAPQAALAAARGETLTDEDIQRVREEAFGPEFARRVAAGPTTTAAEVVD